MLSSEDSTAINQTKLVTDSCEFVFTQILLVFPAIYIEFEGKDEFVIHSNFS